MVPLNNFCLYFNVIMYVLNWYLFVLYFSNDFEFLYRKQS